MSAWAILCTPPMPSGVRHATKGPGRRCPGRSGYRRAPEVIDRGHTRGGVTMRGFRWGVIAVGSALAVICSAPGSAVARGVTVTHIAGERVVPAHAVAIYSARCPAGSYPVAGELSALDASGDGQIALAESYPVGR